MRSMQAAFGLGCRVSMAFLEGAPQRLFAAHVDGSVGACHVFQILAGLITAVLFTKVVVDRFAGLVGGAFAYFPA